MSDRPKKKKKKTIEQIRATNNKKMSKLARILLFFACYDLKLDAISN